MNFLKDDFSKSDLFDLSADFSNDTSQSEENGSIEISNFDLSVYRSELYF